MTSESESPEEVDDDKEPQNDADQNQTLQEIVSSLSEQSNPKASAQKEKQPSAPMKMMRMLTVNDREKVALFYDKSLSMSAPKPSQVPIF